MQGIKKLIIKVFILTHDILSFTYKLIRQISLPNRKRKGNILVSLLILFIGIIVRLNFFEHGFINMSTIFKKKYIKQPILFIGCILFILSLYEWRGDQRVFKNAEINSTEQIASNILSAKPITKSNPVKVFCYEPRLNKKHSYFFYYPNRPLSPPSPVKKFILIRSLLI